MPNDRFDDAWSLSAKCMEKDVVLGKTTRILAAGYQWDMGSIHGL